MLSAVSMAKLIFVICLASLAWISCEGLFEDGYWVWMCDNQQERCQRKPSGSQNLKNVFNSLAVCRLVCGRYGAIWPRPTVKSIIGQEIIPVRPNGFNFQIVNALGETRNFLVENTKLFYDNLVKECGVSCSANPTTSVTVFLTVETLDFDLNWDTNESYSLDIATNDNKVVVQISASNVFGVRYGLETLSQLIASYPIYPYVKNSIKELAIVKDAKIRDKPVYKHRGLLLDTARNFLPVHSIQRQIDAMAWTKMNVLHWHATDSQSFPLIIPSLPLMAKFGAYSPDKTYSPSEIRDLLYYAKLRGVRIILEIDAPSHAGNGWQWGKEIGLGDLAVCVNQNPYRSYCIQPPCGQLNPVNPNIYKVLENLYGDLTGLFPKGEVFHMGGDEVFIPCWNTTQEILSYLHRNGRNRTTSDFLQLWAEYQAEALKVYDKVVGDKNTPIILWSSELTDPNIIAKYLPKDRYIVQTWVPTYDELPEKLLKMGYKLILSTKDAWYLDHGFWGKTSYYSWRVGYSNRLPQHEGVLGGEVCMWGELVDEHVIENRIWPRAAAAAERLWSNPDSGSGSAESRFYIHRERLVTRGIKPEGLAPQWCLQSEGECS